MTIREHQSSDKRRTLVIVRHAHRDTSEGREKDNGLSARGKRQARLVLKQYRKAFGKLRPQLLSSPKKRCLETLTPLSNRRGTSVKPTALLDEGGDFRAKFSAFLKEWPSLQSPVVVICSHGDWIPEFTQSVLGTPIDLAKGGWVELEDVDGKFQLRWVLQELGKRRR